MQITESRPETQKTVANAPPGRIRAAIYGGRYLITSDGAVYSMGIKGGLNIHRQKGRPNSHGYLRVNINRHDEYIHRIVAKCFIPNPNSYLEINHIDGIKTHNTAENLEWCTRSENSRHAFQTGLRSYDELHRMAQMPKFASRRLLPEQVREVRRLIDNGVSCSAIARKFHCSRAVIDGIHNLKTYREEIYQ
ncbi:HNH endonuclease [Victivallis sp. Marseille-Q1083]|uniref:HNH endonuclease n=1 Tax=Victivallis sp. Marseille-Q1083 TaxID=2717288 RepID=UPI00158C591A|nr:HNH endonuclease [Victivallis sp. Marseille-Q1083]